MDNSELDMKLIHAMTAILFLGSNLPGSETRVLNAITGATFMQRKERARLSYSRLAELTGLNRSIAGEAAKRLMQKGYLHDDEGAWRLDLDAMLPDAMAIKSQLFPNAA